MSTQVEKDGKTGTEVEGDGGGWGISSMSAAFGGWGIASTLASGISGADDDAGATRTKFEDDEWKRQSQQVENAAAAAADQVVSSMEKLEHDLEDAVDETAKMASSFFSGAASYFSGAVADADTNTTTASGAGEGDGCEKEEAPTEDVLTSILQYNPLNSLATQWINDLERQSEEHRPLRNHLDAHLKDWPKSTYEEWVEESLVQLDKWDRSSAVVDDTFYFEGSVHRIVWNNRMAADEKRCIAAREPKTATIATASSAASKETMVDTEVKEEKEKPEKAPTSSAVSAAMNLLNEDDDLDGLIGGDSDDDEMVVLPVGDDL